MTKSRSSSARVGAMWSGCGAITSRKRRYSRRCGANAANSGGSGEFGPRIDKTCVTPAAECSLISGMPQMVMRGAVRLVLIGSLSRWQARQNFSRIKAESEYGAAEFLTKPVDFDQLKIQLRELPNASLVPE